MINITTYQEYYYAIKRGYEPLLDRRFHIPILLRVEIQGWLFGRVHLGKGNIPKANDRFYHWVWERKPHICEETMVPLQGYSSKFISHILSRGAYPDMAHDPRNTNILSFEAHKTWEDPQKRKGMRIYQQNKRIIKILKSEYQQYKF